PQSAPARPRLSSPPPRPQLMFVSVANDDTFHKVALARVSAPADGAFITDLTCLRVYFGGDKGICLTSTSDASKNSWWAEVFDNRFQTEHRMPLTGEP